MTASLNELLDAYEVATGVRAGGHTADLLTEALLGRLSDYDWERLPFQVTDLLDPGSKL